MQNFSIFALKLNHKPMSETEKRLVYSIKESAYLLDMSVRTVWKMIEEKELSTVKIRKTTKITREEIDKYLKNQQK